MRFFSVCHRIGIGKLLKAASSSQSAAPRLSSSDFCCAFIHTRFFFMLFSFSTIVEFNCRKKTKKGARSLRYKKTKKNKKKGKKKTRKKKRPKNRHKIIVAFDMRTTLHFGRGGFGDGKRRRCDDTRARRC